MQNFQILKTLAICSALIIAPTAWAQDTSVDENAPNGTLVGVAVAVDPDVGDTFTYELLDDASGRFAIDSVTGEAVVANSALLDYEVATSHNIIIKATDNSGLSYQKTFTTQVLDISENEAPTDITFSLPSVVNGLYGNPYEGTSLANFSLVGGRSVDYKFRAEKTGSIKNLIWINKNNGTPGPGNSYWNGDGGNVLISIRTDDGTSNHYPSDTVLGSYHITDPLSISIIPEITFSSPIAVTEGELYHIMFSNDSADPVNNFVSVNTLAYWSDTPQPANVDEEVDLGVLFSDQNYPPTTWGTFSSGYRYSPIFSLEYTDGFGQGQGNMAAYRDPQANIFITSPNNQVRQTFIVSGGSKTVESVSVRLIRESGNAALTFRLEESDGTLIEEGFVDSSAIPIGTNWHDHVWITYQFQTLRTLQDGVSYNLVLGTTIPDTRYSIYPLRDGSATSYGFHPDTAFSDGRAEYTDDGVNWKGWSYWNIDDRPDTDLQFYFTLSTNT